LPKLADMTRELGCTASSKPVSWTAHHIVSMVRLDQKWVKQQRMHPCRAKQHGTSIHLHRNASERRRVASLVIEHSLQALHLDAEAEHCPLLSSLQQQLAGVLPDNLFYLLRPFVRLRSAVSSAGAGRQTIARLSMLADCCLSSVSVLAEPSGHGVDRAHHELHLDSICALGRIWCHCPRRARLLRRVSGCCHVCSQANESANCWPIAEEPEAGELHRHVCVNALVVRAVWLPGLEVKRPGLVVPIFGCFVSRWWGCPTQLCTVVRSGISVECLMQAVQSMLLKGEDLSHDAQHRAPMKACLGRGYPQAHQSRPRRKIAWMCCCERCCCGLGGRLHPETPRRRPLLHPATRTPK
jgi:hypothetical protein